MEEAFPRQSLAKLRSAGDNVLYFPTVQSSVIRSEMKLILQYIDKGNLTAFPGPSERDCNLINL